MDDLLPQAAALILPVLGGGVTVAIEEFARTNGESAGKALDRVINALLRRGEVRVGDVEPSVLQGSLEAAVADGEVAREDLQRIVGGPTNTVSHSNVHARNAVVGSTLSVGEGKIQVGDSR